MNPPITGQSDDLNVLLDILPERVHNFLDNHPQQDALIEVVLDLGHPPEMRFSDTVLRATELGNILQEDIEAVVQNIGMFNSDNRAGIERTLHRISAIRNRTGKIIGLTCRVGRAVLGTVDIIKDIVESGQNCLFLGPPGIGKTTLLRETARVLSDESQKRVVVVDTSNEIAGDGDIPHPAIGFARRMQVPSPSLQHAVMIEAVENHMPEVIVVDEIGTEEETRAARTIAERGVQLVATAHGRDIQNLIKNPMLSDLVGGVQSVVLGDEEAKFRGTNKTVLERKALPTFDVVIEIKSRDEFVIFNPVARFVDAILREDPLDPEVRIREKDGAVTIDKGEETQPETVYQDPQDEISIYPFGIKTELLASVIHSLDVPVSLAKNMTDADMVITTKSKVGAKSKVQKLLQGKSIPLHVLPGGNVSQLNKFLRNLFSLSETEDDKETEAIREVQRACNRVVAESRVVELAPQSAYVRHVQREIASKFGLNAMSVGEEPNRRVRVYPGGE